MRGGASFSLRFQAGAWKRGNNSKEVVMKMDSRGESREDSTMEGKSLKNVVDFLFELGMLKRTPRSGYQFLGTGGESVADHSFRAALIAYTLARLTGYPEPCRVACLCLFHDVPEARTGDLNYVNKQYVKADEQKAIDDLAEKLPFGGDYREMMAEYIQADSEAAHLAHDADQLDLILNLKEQMDLGNQYAPEWIRYARGRLTTPIGGKVAAAIMECDHTGWWFDGHDHWWSRNHEG